MYIYIYGKVNRIWRGIWRGGMAMSREAFAQVRRNRGLSMKNYIYYFFEERKKGEKMVERKNSYM